MKSEDYEFVAFGMSRLRYLRKLSGELGKVTKFHVQPEEGGEVYFGGQVCHHSRSAMANDEAIRKRVEDGDKVVRAMLLEGINAACELLICELKTLGVSFDKSKLQDSK